MPVDAQRVYVDDQPGDDGTFLLFRMSEGGGTVKLGYVFADSGLSRAVLTLDEQPNTDTAEPKLGIIGHERALMDIVAKEIHDSLTRHRRVRRNHEYTQLREDRRGSHFEIRVFDIDGNPTGHIARVTVELDRRES